MATTVKGRKGGKRREKGKGKKELSTVLCGGGGKKEGSSPRWGSLSPHGKGGGNTGEGKGKSRKKKPEIIIKRENFLVQIEKNDWPVERPILRRKKIVGKKSKRKSHRKGKKKDKAMSKGRKGRCRP